jgi:hypothetical protein
VPSQDSPCIRQVFLLSDYALMIPKQVTEVLFAVPWHNKIVVGTDTVMKSTA